MLLSKLSFTYIYARSANSAASPPKAFFVSIALKSDPAWNEREPGVGRDEKTATARVDININMAVLVMLRFFSAQTNKQKFSLSPRPGELPSPLEESASEKVLSYCAT
jgi:hypothetical protein